jgi:hypothetical protein
MKTTQAIKCERCNSAGCPALKATYDSVDDPDSYRDWITADIACSLRAITRSLGSDYIYVKTSEA